MNPQQCQSAAMAGAADDSSEVVRLIRDFPDWQIAYGSAGFWSAERKPSPARLELHCAYNLEDLRAKLVGAVECVPARRRRARCLTCDSTGGAPVAGEITDAGPGTLGTARMVTGDRRD